MLLEKRPILMDPEIEVNEESCLWNSILDSYQTLDIN